MYYIYIYIVAVLKQPNASFPLTANFDQISDRSLFCSNCFQIKEKHASKPGDVLIASYPKSGTTWISNIVNLLLDEPQGKDLDLNEG